MIAAAQRPWAAWALGPCPCQLAAQAPGSRSVAHSPASSAANRSAQGRRPVRGIAPRQPRARARLPPGPGSQPSHRPGCYDIAAPSLWRRRPACRSAPAYLVRDLPSGWPGRHCIANFAAPFRPTPASRQLSAVLPIMPIHKESDLTRPGQPAQIYVHEIDNVRRPVQTSQPIGQRGVRPCRPRPAAAAAPRCSRSRRPFRCF